MSLREEKKVKNEIVAVSISAVMILAGFFSLIFIVDTAEAAPGDPEIPSCFLPGTPINMADGSYKNIEDVEIGDEVKVFNQITEEIDSAVVKTIKTVYHDNVHNLVLENDKILEPTANHPFYVRDKGWCTISGLDELGMGAGKLEIGDYLYQLTSDESLEWVKVVDIMVVEGNYLTYNFIDMKYGTFIADDIIVHNSDPPEPECCFPAGTMIGLADGGQKPIEGIISGEEVFSFNLDSCLIEKTVVEQLIVKVREGVYDINDGLISPTNDHPLYVRKPDGTMGWASVNPSKSQVMYYYREIMPLSVGDELFTSDSSWVKIDSIVFRPGMIETYTFRVESKSHNYFANNMLVSNPICGFDEQAPVIGSYSPDSCSWTNSFPQVTVSCTDNVGLDGYQYSFTTSTSTPGSYTTSESFGKDDTGFTTVSAVPVGGSGTYYLHVRITDTSSNPATGYSGPYRFDAIDPTNSISPASEPLGKGYVNTEAPADLDVTDAHSGTNQYRYKWTTSTTKPTTGWSNWAAIVEGKGEITSQSSHGNWYLHTESTDNAVNDDYDYSGPYAVNTAPTGSFTGGNQAIVTSTGVAFSDSSTDDDSITNYSWDLNNDGNYDDYGADISYTFRHPYNYTVALKLTDSDGAVTTVTKYVAVKDTYDFVSGKNFFVWRKNASVMASTLSSAIGLSTGDSITRFNASAEKNDWDETYVTGTFCADFVINRHDVVKINLESAIKDVDFGCSDTLNSNVNMTLRYIDSEGQTNYGYNAIPWVMEDSIRASDLAIDLSLPDYYTINIYNTTTQSYKSYLKLPGNPTAGIDSLDPMINCGQIVWVKVPAGAQITYDSSKITKAGSILIDDCTAPPMS